MTYTKHDLLHANFELIEDSEFHISPTGLVTVDGVVYTLDQVDPELADRELRAALERYHALCRRPRSRQAWSAVANRLWNAMQGPANLAMLPLDSPRRKEVAKMCRSASARAESAAILRRSV